MKSSFRWHTTKTVLLAPNSEVQGTNPAQFISIGGVQAYSGYNSGLVSSPRSMSPTPAAAKTTTLSTRQPRKFGSKRTETKRRRVTKSDPDNGLRPDAVGSSIRGGNGLRPDAVGSSIRGSNPAVLVDAPLAARSTGFFSSPRDISRTLGKLENRSSRINGIRALEQIQEWLANDKATTESSKGVLEHFYFYGGVARTLDFLEDNMDDLDCVMIAAAVLSDFLSFRWNGTVQNREIAMNIAKTIVQRNGIPLLLLANQEFLVGQRTSSATKHVWIAIGRTINGEETRCILDKKQKLNILSDAIDCIFRLEKTGSEDWADGVLQVVLYTIANTIKDASIEKEDLKRLDIVPGCLMILEKESDQNRSDDVITYALGILTMCTKQKKLVRKKDFEQLLPILIRCMKQFGGNSQIRSFVLALLAGACEKLPKETMEKAGVLEANSTLLKSDGLSEEVKERARSIMRKILN
ncbi:unnamed protein product [Pseudo-nitzschia multistriata]|uniref:Uncharacterized protein n=1 Tax=Pseudo-nitzschia multistriata TaxID=183589 RepID=A0A448ZSI5_9STRA|nr:unnamed protein product [Pseudo-nitzschia multistriata]